MIGELFDPKAELYIHERLRPHWSQAGAIVFATFRTKDSIPREVLSRWEREKQEWVERVLKNSRGPLRGPTPANSQRHPSETIRTDSGALDHGVVHDYQHWSQLLELLSEEQRHDFDLHFNRCREVLLDECRGACVLKRPELSQIVADALMHFDGERYRMGDFVVMPNHVHLLAAFPDPVFMERQFASWLRFTATRINQRLNQKGHFWQQEPFDHLVRSPQQYDYLRTYIAENPKRAKLSAGEYHYRKYD
jgi:putative transposase